MLQHCTINISRDRRCAWRRWETLSKSTANNTCVLSLCPKTLNRHVPSAYIPDSPMQIELTRAGARGFKKSERCHKPSTQIVETLYGGCVITPHPSAPESPDYQSRRPVSEPAVWSGTVLQFPDRYPACSQTSPHNRPVFAERRLQ